MAVQPPVAEPGEPSNRWPWVALALGLLVVAVAVAYFFFNRQRTVNITVEGTPTVAAIAAAGTASPGPPPTLVPPTLPPSATLAPTATVAPSPTPPPPAPTNTPAPTQPPAPPTPTQAPAQVAAPPPAAQPTQPPTAAQPTQPPAAGQPTPTQPAPQATSAPPSPTPFAGQVANAGGLGNTRSDFDAAYGQPAGETPDHLLVYRKNNFEYHVNFVPDPNGRAALLVDMPQPQTNASPFTLESAMAEAHKLLPKDAQPPNPQPEGNDQFVVERYTSQLLGQALPASVFTANQGQPGQFLAVYVRDPAQQGRISRFILGPGTDPQALLNQGR